MQHNPYGISSLWLQGDAVTRTIAILLLLMSLVSWHVLLTRAWQLLQLRRQARAAQAFWHAHSFDEGLQALLAQGRDNPFLRLAEEGRHAAEHHRTHQGDLHGHLPLSDWISDCLRSGLDSAAERMQRGLPVLASVGATAPFVGLFGTVWGIYHALTAIGVAGQASIAQVAGPVGEALIMTAFGLAVAIPAVLGFNALARGNRAVVGRLNQFAHNLHAYFVTGAPVLDRHTRPQLVAVAGQGA